MKLFVIRKADGKLSVQEIEVAATDNVAVPPGQKRTGAAISS